MPKSSQPEKKSSSTTKEVQKKKEEELRSVSPPPPDADEVPPEVEPMDEVEEVQKAEEVENVENGSDTGGDDSDEDGDDGDNKVFVPEGEPKKMPDGWVKKWGIPNMAESEEALKAFRSKEGNKHHKLPEGKELCTTLGLDVPDDNVEKCVELYTELRKEWKKLNFPPSKRSNTVPFCEYEAMVMAELYEGAYKKFVDQAKLHDAAHKPKDRLEHYEKYATLKRKKYDDLVKKRVDRAKEAKVKRDALVTKRREEAPERKEAERMKVVSKAINEFKKSPDMKDMFLKMREETSRLMKEEKLSHEAASQKAQEIILGF